MADWGGTSFTMVVERPRTRYGVATISRKAHRVGKKGKGFNPITKNPLGALDKDRGAWKQSAEK